MLNHVYTIRARDEFGKSVVIAVNENLTPVECDWADKPSENPFDFKLDVHSGFIFKKSNGAVVAKIDDMGFIIKLNREKKIVTTKRTAQQFVYSDTCIVCGDYVPEGYQVCPYCKSR